MFDAGALIFRIMTVGRQQHEQDQKAAQDSFDKTGKAAKDAASKVDESGNATGRQSKKSRDSKKPLEDQSKATEEVGEQSRKAKSKQDEQAKATESQAESAKKLATVLTIAGVAVAAMVGLSVAKFTEFDKAMSQTSAATMATAEDQRALGEAALEAGADTAYSASEAAAAEEELAKAGQSVSDIVGGSLNGALALAAAGQLQVARSAEIMATTLTQFRLPAEQAARVSDILAAGAGKAQGSVDDLALALSYVGPLAGSVGFSLEETAGTIAYFATQGIIGEKAGTSLRGVLASLQAPSAAAGKEMEKYGINMFDANGEMLSLAGIAEQLRTRLGGLSEQERLAALGRIFGNESLNAATLLYEGGARAVEKWTAEVNDSGYAAEQASMRQDNLAGDVEKLGGAFDTALIRTGSGANDILREMVQGLTFLVDVFGEAPAPVHAVALGLGVAAAAALLFGGAAVSVRARMVELKTQLDDTGTSFRKTALVGAAAGLALTGVLTVISILVSKQAEMAAGTEAFADTLDDATGAVTDYTRELIAKKLADAGAFDGAREAGISQRELTDALFEGGAAYEAVMRKLRDAHNASGGWNATIGNSINATKDLNLQLTNAKQRHDDVKAATDENTVSTQSAAGAYVDAAQRVSDLEDELSTLIDTMNEANGVGQDAISANISYQDALAKVDEQIRKAKEGQEGYALTLDTGTQAGRDNLGMLNEMAAKSQAAADAQFALDGNTELYRQNLESGRQALIDRITDITGNRDAAQQLADQIYRIPTESEWKLIAQTAEAEERIKRIQGIIDGLRGKTIGVNAVVNLRTPSGKPVTDQQIADQLGFGSANGNFIESYANGGIREQHVAQMARAGAWRVWAEPETGGESYIPHAPSKRARSEAIMTETAAVLGGVYIPSGATQFAGGSGPASTLPLDGMRITGTLDLGGGLTGVIDGRIAAHDQSQARVARGRRAPE